MFFFSLLIPASIQAEEKPFNKLQVNGVGEYQVVPDIGEITLGIEADNRIASNAQKKVSEVVSEFISEIKNIGIKDGEILTVENSLNPNRDYNLNPPRITGYTAVQKIRIKVKGNERIKLLSKIVDIATQKSINNISSINFSISAELLKEANIQALELASQNALNKGKTVLNSLGLNFVKIREININDEYYPAPIYNNYRADMMMKAAPESAVASGTEFMTGESTVRARIYMVVEYN